MNIIHKPSKSLVLNWLHFGVQPKHFYGQYKPQGTEHISAPNESSGTMIKAETINTIYVPIL